MERYIAMKIFRDFIYGIIIGITNIIPGVSGGTMAVILKIYDKILYAISLKNIESNLKFLIPLGLGTITGIFAFSNLMLSLLKNHQMLLNFCFIGLILGSIPMIYKRARYEKVKPRNIAVFMLALALMLGLSFVEGSDNPESYNGIVSADTSGIMLYATLILATAISMIAMLLPGISGSLIMLLLGTYTITLKAIAEFDFILLLFVAIGALLGGFLGIKGIKKMLRFHPQALYFAILGLIVGSLFTIYPGFTADSEGFLSLILLVSFAAISYIFSIKSN